MQALILFSCLVAAASAWNCPDLPVVEKLNVTLLAGTWYQQSLAGLGFFTQPGGYCTLDRFAEDTTGKSLFTFKNAQTMLFERVEVNGWADFADSENPNGKLKATIPTMKFFDQTSDLWVLDTDYDNFLVLYSCKKVLGVPAQSSWILRRTANPQGDVKTELDSLITNAFVNIELSGGPDLADFVATNQDDCLG